MGKPRHHIFEAIVFLKIDVSQNLSAIWKLMGIKSAMSLFTTNQGDMSSNRVNNSKHKMEIYKRSVKKWSKEGKKYGVEAWCVSYQNSQ